MKTIKHKITGVEYALKSIRLNRMDKSKREMLIQEVELMRQMDRRFFKILFCFLNPMTRTNVLFSFYL